MGLVSAYSVIYNITRHCYNVCSLVKGKRMWLQLVCVPCRMHDRVVVTSWVLSYCHYCVATDLFLSGVWQTKCHPCHHSDISGVLCLGPTDVTHHSGNSTHTQSEASYPGLPTASAVAKGIILKYYSEMV